MSNYRNQLESYLKTLDIKADRVLDVGGAAKPVNKRTKSWDVLEYHIWDTGLEERDKSHVIDYDIDINVPWPDRSKVDVHPYIKNYDIIFCLEVFEYVYNPITAVNNLFQVLTPGGLLYITLPFLYPVHEPHENDYLRYTCAGAGRLLAEAGFKVLDIIPRVMTLKGFELWKEFMIAEGMHWSKHSRHDQLGFIIKATKC